MKKFDKNYSICFRLSSSHSHNNPFFKQESQYARWLAGCRLAAKGRTLAHSSGFDAEVRAIQAFLSMQHPARQPVINPLTLDIQIEDYVAQRFLRKPKSKVSFRYKAEM